jgi:hypothetical protein
LAIDTPLVNYGKITGKMSSGAGRLIVMQKQNTCAKIIENGG